ncbi:MAG: hypothetical protein ABMB14_19440, partial [Myxococcota bacterium]
MVLHLAADRSTAAWIAPLAIAWGVVITARAGRIADVGPWWLLVAALAVRGPLIGTPPLLSDDLYRYLWEGHALAAGHDVFTEAPATIAGLDDALRARVNHPDIPSVYPPLALAWFRLLAWFGTPAAVQASTALVDATVPLAIRAATGRAGPAWLYALHPLPALESACGGHVDVPAWALAAAGVAAWRLGRREAAWAAIVAGALTKLFPIVLAPVVLRAASPRRAVGWLVAGALAVGLSLAWVVGPSVPPGVRAYAGSWAFDGFAYPWLAPVLGEATRPALVAAAGLVAGAVWWRIRDPGHAWL